MLIFTDGSAINIPGLTGAGAIIRKMDQQVYQLNHQNQLNFQELATKNLKELRSAQNTLKKLYQTALKIYISL